MTQRYHTTDPPMLPVELWKHTLRLATAFEMQLDVLNDVHLLDEYALQDTIQALYRSNLSTKFQLILVCKGWHSVAIELLYEEVYITSMYRLDCLKNTLIRQSECTPPGSLRYGWWTKVLQIPFRSTIIGQGADVTPLVLETIRHFPNLTALIVQGWHYAKEEEYDYMAKGLNQLTPNLRYLSCNQWDQERALAGSVFALHVPSLQTLRTVWGASSTASPRIFNEKLTSLSLSMDGDIPLTDFHFRSLTSIIFQGSSIAYPGVVRFIEAHGEQLLTLGFNGLGGIDSFDDAKPTLLERFLCTCPNLRKLLLGRMAFSAHDPIVLGDYQSFPSIELLGVALGDRILTREGWEQNLPLDRFPNLRVIRLLDKLDARNMPEGSVAEKVVARVGDGPPRIVFEDVLGSVIRYGGQT